MLVDLSTAVLFSKHVVHSRNCDPSPSSNSLSRQTVSLAKLRLSQVDSHGDPGTVCRAEVGVAKEIDSSAVNTYAAQRPKKVEDTDSASCWRALRLNSIAVSAVQDLKHN